MTTDTKHPSYEEKLNLWRKLRDCHAGEHQIKARALTYVPVPSGMREDGFQIGQPGRNAYDSYVIRARFPDYIEDAVATTVGVMHHKPPKIELPPELEPLRQRATLEGEPLDILLRKINEAQLITGRVGLLADIPNNTRKNQSVVSGNPVNDLPYIAMYGAEHIINWDVGYRDGLGAERLNLVVLDESEYERQTDFSWHFVEKQRVLILGDINTNTAAGQYRNGVVREKNNFDPEELTQPQFRGRSPDGIPFTFINATDLVAAPDNPPLLGLADLLLSIFRQDCDYKQSLFMNGQDTLVIVGGNPEDDIRVGTGARVNVPIGGDAKFVGVSSTGLAEQRTSLENDKDEARSKAGELLSTGASGNRESGDALYIRVAARTASVKQIAQTGAAGLEDCLKKIAVWTGASPEAVKVTPNLDFTDSVFDADSFIKLVSGKTLGAPLSLQSLHRWMSENDLTNLTLEEELALIKNEEPLVIGVMEDAGAKEDPE